MAGRDPAEALRNFIAPLRQALHCITEAPLSVPDVRGHDAKIETEYTATLSAGKPITLHGEHRLQLRVGHVFRLVETNDAERGPVKASTVRYQYIIGTRDGQEIVAYQWTPAADPPQRTFPHMHIGSLVTRESVFLGKTFSNLHLPTGRVSLESVVRFLIEDLEVGTIIDPAIALERLRQSEAAFHRYRTI